MIFAVPEIHLAAYECINNTETHNVNYTEFNFRLATLSSTGCAIVRHRLVTAAISFDRKWH